MTIRLALAVMPGKNYLLVLGSKTLREKLSIDVMKQFRDTAAASGGDTSITKHAPAVVPAMSPEIIGVHRVVVTMEATQVADIKVEAAGGTNRFEDAILRAARAGMPPDDLAKLLCLVLGPYKEAFRWGLTGEPPAQVELGSVPVKSMAAYACSDTDYSLPSKSAIKDKKLELVELVGGQTSVRTTFDPGVEDIVTDRSRGVNIARMRPYADASLNVAAELKEVLNNLKSQGEFDMEKIEAVNLAADSEEYVVKVKWVGLDEEKTTWEPGSTIYAYAPKYVVAQLRKLRLTKEVRDDLKKKYGMKVYF